MNMLKVDAVKAQRLISDTICKLMEKDEKDPFGDGIKYVEKYLLKVIRNQYFDEFKKRKKEEIHTILLQDYPDSETEIELLEEQQQIETPEGAVADFLNKIEEHIPDEVNREIFLSRLMNYPYEEYTRKFT